MKYLIDFKMLYEVDDCKLMILGEEESSLQLSNPAGRLLYELTINNMKVLDRDYLIKTVWEDKGFSGSSISLNVSISEIRKAFRKLNCDPLLIKTIRGKGFSLVAHVEHHTVRPPVPQEPTESNDAIPEPPKDITSKLHILVRKQFILALIPVLIVSVMVVTTFIIDGNLMRFQFFQTIDTQTFPLGKINKCQVYLPENKINVDMKKNLDDAKRAIDQHNIDCKNQNPDIYYSSFSKDQMEIYFIGVCYHTINSARYIYCKSYKIITGI